jgi:hypothetical protein
MSNPAYHNTSLLGIAKCVVLRVDRTVSRVLLLLGQVFVLKFA